MAEAIRRHILSLSSFLARIRTLLLIMPLPLLSTSSSTMMSMSALHRLNMLLTRHLLRCEGLSLSSEPHLLLLKMLMLSELLLL